MIYLTVGSMFPFDRLIRAVDEMVGSGAIADRVVAQIGEGRYEPRHMPFDRFLAAPEHERLVAEAEMLIGHAGSGTIALALQHRKPLLVVPRLRRYAEHVNDHQIPTARKYAELGCVVVAQNTSDIPMLLPALARFTPRPREVRPKAVAMRIGRFLGAH